MIPIENVYMMLAYAWNRLDEAKLIDVDTLPQKDLPNLLARVLCTGTTHLIKRGFHKEYKETSDEMTTLRGRIDAGQSIKRVLLPRGRAVCQYDDYSADVIQNQIIKATLVALVRCDDVDASLRLEIRKLLFRFADVADMRLSTSVFAHAVVHPHTARYGFLLDVCKLVFEELLPTEKAGRSQFRDFRRDKRKMWRVFQDFVRNFYDKEQTVLKVGAPHVKWDIPQHENESRLLPTMQTDVSLESASRHIILDTKFTAKVFRVNYGKPSLCSGHLYQMLTYMHQQAAHNAKMDLPVPEGILLYPLAKDDVYERYTVSGQSLTVVTVDLNQSWDHIHGRLLDIVQPKPLVTAQ
jgi:5-methylcytosine-specific restriction enzyme subunit McrC